MNSRGSYRNKFTRGRVPKRTSADERVRVIHRLLLAVSLAMDRMHANCSTVGFQQCLLNHRTSILRDVDESGKASSLDAMAQPLVGVP